MQLDQHQQAAVDTTSARALVSAVPGSGKTLTLTHRFLKLVEEVPPSKIVLLTFTRHAAREIKARIGEKAGLAFIGTFHSFALSIVRQWGKVQGWEPSWLGVLDDWTAMKEEWDVLVDVGLKSKRGGWSGVSWADKAGWEHYKARMLVDPAGESASASERETYGPAWGALCGSLKSQNVLTYQTLIYEARKIMGMEYLAPEIRKNYRHFLVDECQDTDLGQWSLMEDFEPDTIFAVGDIDQSIYEWRGACPQNIIEFSKTAERYTLPTTYRFGANVAEPANTLIQRNMSRIPVTIKPADHLSGGLTYFAGEQAGITGVVDFISSLVEDGARETDIAVIGRTHRQLDVAASQLIAAGHTVDRITPNDEMTKMPMMRAAMGYVRLACNPKDNRAFMAVAQHEGLTPEAILEIRKEALARGCSLSQCTRSIQPDTLESIQDHMLQARVLSRLEIHEVKDAIQWLGDLMWTEGITEIRELIEVFAMRGVQDKMPSAPEGITVCTVHAAKGLEWPAVCVIGLTEGRWPSSGSIREGRLEEERRLAYVAITRAEKHLMIANTSTTKPESMFMPEMKS